MVSAKLKVQKCYYCNGDLNDRDLVIKPVPLVCMQKSKDGKKKQVIRNYKRKFHFKCIEKFINENEDIYKKREENSEWEDVYYYFRDDILNIPPTTNLPEFAVKRLLGLRTGSFIPNATNTRVIKQGASFKVILNAMKLSKQEILSAFRTQNVNDYEHKINLAMFIIKKHIPFIEERMRKIDKINNDSNKIEIVEKPVAEYVRKGGRKFNFD